MPCFGYRQFLKSGEGPFMFLIWTILLNLLSNDVYSVLQTESRVLMRIVPYGVLCTIAMMYWFVRQGIQPHYPQLVETIQQPFMCLLGTLALNFVSNDISSALQGEVTMKFVPYVVLIIVALLYKLAIHRAQEVLHQASPQVVINIDNEYNTHSQRGLLRHNRRVRHHVQLVSFLEHFIMSWDLSAGSTLINRALGMRDLWHMDLSAGSNVIGRTLGIRDLRQINVSAATTPINGHVDMEGSTMIDRALEMEDLRHNHLSTRRNGLTTLDVAPAILAPNEKKSLLEMKPEPPAPEIVMKGPVAIEPAVGVHDQIGNVEPSSRAQGDPGKYGISADGVRRRPQVRSKIPSSARKEWVNDGSDPWRWVEHKSPPEEVNDGFNPGGWVDDETHEYARPPWLGGVVREPWQLGVGQRVNGNGVILVGKTRQKMDFMNNTADSPVNFYG